MIAIFVSLHTKDSVLTCLCPTLTSPVGNTDIYSPPNQDFGVSSIETHPDYRADDLCNDLVIIEPSFQCSAPRALIQSTENDELLSRKI